MRYSWKGILLCIGFGLLITTMVQAVGNGPGGTPPDPCTEDTWSCTNWSTCSLDGTQTRDCSLSENCPTVEDPKPTESRSCTPECTEDTWSCSSWSSCAIDGTQTRNCTLSDDCSLVNDPKPVTEQSCKPDCTEDTWTCSDWATCSQAGTQTRDCALTFDCALANTVKPSEKQSCTPERSPSTNTSTPDTSNSAKCTEDTWDCDAWSQCQENGHQVRSCTLATDCASADTPRPEEDRACEGLKCGQLGTLQERIACRLELTEEEATTENNILYFPEYCKVEKSQEEKIQCIARYQSFGPCWNTTSSDRPECAKKVIGLQSAQDESATCFLPGSTEEQTTCASVLKEKVEHYVIFALYELEFHAETLLESGKLTRSQVVDLEVYIEQQKQRLDEVTTVSEWKTIVQETKSYWNGLTSTL